MVEEGRATILHRKIRGKLRSTDRKEVKECGHLGQKSPRKEEKQIQRWGCA